MANTKVAEGFAHHIILYSKGWYGQSKGKNHIIKDLKILLAAYSNTDITYLSDRDIWEHLVLAFAKYGTTNVLATADSLIEMLGKKYGYDAGFSRNPEEVIIGALSVTMGELVDTKEMLKGNMFPI